MNRMTTSIVPLTATLLMFAAGAIHADTTTASDAAGSGQIESLIVGDDDQNMIRIVLAQGFDDQSSGCAGNLVVNYEDFTSSAEEKRLDHIVTVVMSAMLAKRTVIFRSRIGGCHVTAVGMK